MGHATEVAKDLPVTTIGGRKRGREGERRFAPKMGRGGLMKSTESARMGVVWRRIQVFSRDVYMHTDWDSKDRVSFIFKEQNPMVTEVYRVLAMLDESERAVGWWE